MPLNNPNNYYQNQYPMSTQNYYQQPIAQNGQPVPVQEFYMGCSGKEEVNKYPQAPNTRIWFTDVRNLKVYVKVRDINGGVPYIEREFDMNEVCAAAPVEEVPKTNESELGALRTEIQKLSAELASIKPVIDELRS